MAKNDTLKTASVLAFERKLDPSDALLYASNWDKRQDEQQCDPHHRWRKEEGVCQLESVSKSLQQFRDNHFRPLHATPSDS